MIQSIEIEPGTIMHFNWGYRSGIPRSAEVTVSTGGNGDYRQRLLGNIVKHGVTLFKPAEDIQLTGFELLGILKGIKELARVTIPKDDSDLDLLSGGFL